jgi:hypothetical protein
VKGVRDDLTSSVGNRTVLEILETLGEEFDETGVHVLQRKEFSSLRLSPVRPLPVERLISGAVGWLREVRLAEAQDRQDAVGTETLAGWLYFVAHPSLHLDPTEPESSPLVGTPWSSFAYVEECHSPPGAILAAKSDSEAAVPILRKFSEAVRAELEAESEF